jgi:hypothetical protein
MPRPLYHQEIAFGTHWIRGWVGPRTGLNDMEKRKFLPPPGLELRPLGRPACSRLLYWLRYSGTKKNVSGSTECPSLLLTIFQSLRKFLRIKSNCSSGLQIWELQGRGYTKETGNCNATAISEKCRRFQAGNWFSRLAGIHWGSLCFSSCSNHLKWVYSSDVMRDCICFNFVHLPSAMENNNTDPVIIWRQLRRREKRGRRPYAKYSDANYFVLIKVNLL